MTKFQDSMKAVGGVDSLNIFLSRRIYGGETCVS